MSIESAVNITQFSFVKRLITLIGEFHEVGWKCSGTKNLSINDYLCLRTKENPKCIILLEFHPELTDSKIGMIGSEVIRKIYKNNCQKNMEIRKRIIGIDIRTDYIGRDGQTNLYNKDKIHSKYTATEFKETFIDSFFKENDGYFGLVSQTHDLDETVQKNMKKYSKQIYNDFIKAETETNNPKKLQLLKECFAKITDFNILLEIFKKRDCNEIIIVVGEFHRKNLTDVLMTFTNITHVSTNIPIDSDEEDKPCFLVDDLIVPT